MLSILIADDEPIERVVLSKMIQKYYSEQLHIVQAVNGREAISLFEQQQCRIAILDIEMPGINGLEAAQAIRKKHPGCSIIFLTAFDEFAYARKAIAVKALDYLLKPCTDEELTAVLDEALRLAEAAQHRQQETEPAQEQEQTELQESPETESLARDRIRVSRERILDYIHRHYQEDISLQDAAGEFHYSDVYFCKLFKQCFDQNFTAYMAQYRIEKAKELLHSPLINVKEAGERAGYRDANYFTKVFKRHTGMTPSDYQMKAAEGSLWEK